MKRFHKHVLKLLFYSYYRTAAKYNSHETSVFYASMMSALNLLLVITNIVLFLDIMTPATKGPFQLASPNVVGFIAFSIGISTYVLIRTGKRHERILKTIRTFKLTRKDFLKAKIIAFAIPLILFTGSSIMAFIIGGG